MNAARSAIAALAVATVCLAGCSSSGAKPKATTAPPAGGTTGGATTNSTAGSKSGGGPPGAITLHVKANFTSPYAITDTYDWTFDPGGYAENGDSTPVPTSCADLAKDGTQSGGQGSAPTFQTPNPAGDGTMASGKDSLDLQAVVDKYAGPKTYTGADVDGTAGLDISNTAKLPDNGDGGLTFDDIVQKSSVTVNADGSGTTTIVGWQDSGGRTAAGTLTWTCSG